MSSELTVQKQYGGLLDPSTWKMLREQCSDLVKSGFLAKDINTPEKAIAIALKGLEMGLGPMAAFSGISIVNGKPVVEGQLMMAQILRLVPGAKIEYLERTDKICRLRALRPGSDWQEFSWTIDDARRAGLDKKPGPWTTYPRNMLQWRAVADMARAVFPDAIMGAYLQDEIEPIDVTPPPPSKGRAEAMEALLGASDAPKPTEPVKLAPRAAVDLMLEEFAKINIPAEVLLESVMAKDRDSVTEANMVELRNWFVIERDRHFKSQH